MCCRFLAIIVFGKNKCGAKIFVHVKRLKSTVRKYINKRTDRSRTRVKRARERESTKTYPRLTRALASKEKITLAITLLILTVRLHQQRLTLNKRLLSEAVLSNDRYFQDANYYSLPTHYKYLNSLPTRNGL